MWVKTSKINWWEWFAKETFNDDYYPQSIQEFTIANLRRYRLHPTQKPVALIEYLIKTYTNEWEIVLDFTAWSFTTAVACENTNRKWICIEKEKEYFDKWIERLNNLQPTFK
jgi:site-specific DNA-methyltransferase (adenine-specific)